MPPPLEVEYCGAIHATEVLNPTKPWKQVNNHDNVLVAVAVLLYGSWNVRTASKIHDDTAPRWATLVGHALSTSCGGSAAPNIKCLAASVKVDDNDESMDACVGGFGAPSELPAIVLLLDCPVASPGTGMTTNQRNRVEHVQFSGAALESILMDHSLSSSSDEAKFLLAIGEAWNNLSDPSENSTPLGSRINIVGNEDEYIAPVRIFIAGDRSQVGKSSVCLGILGSLLNSGKYSPDDLAYIKPATQCEQTQLVEEYCKHKGIAACVPVGPIVYYKGFTRAFLKGETGETSEDLLRKASDAVDNLAFNKKVVIIDGVGYPSVGSITGTDNASVAKACGQKFSPSLSTTDSVRSPVPVLLIGKSGVGDSIDSFNINATYFTHRNVPVIGAVFNKLSLDGFYSLSNCKEAIDLYFRQFQPNMRAFGYIPEIQSLSNSRENLEFKSCEEQLQHALDTADLFVKEFQKHVNVDMIVQAAVNATSKFIADYMPSASNDDQVENAPCTKLNTGSKMEGARGIPLSREQIEAFALAAGAAGG